MNEGRVSPNRRKYDNRLREEQAELTRERVLRAVAEELAESGRAFSIEDVAKKAGVSVPTIYRHFKNRDGLYVAFEAWFRRHHGGALAVPTTLDELVDSSVAFEFFEDNAELVLAASALRENNFPRDPETGAPMRLRAEVLSPLLEGLGEDEAHAVVALFRFIRSSLAWKSLTRELDVEPERASAVVTWANRALVAELKRARARRKKSEGRS